MQFGKAPYAGIELSTNLKMSVPHNETLRFINMMWQWQALLANQSATQKPRGPVHEHKHQNTCSQALARSNAVLEKETLTFIQPSSCSYAQEQTSTEIQNTHIIRFIFPRTSTI